MAETTVSMKESFIHQQQNRVDEVLVEAQRLVNLYRHSDAFGDDFNKKLDDLLINIKPEVLTALSDIQGGIVVRRYCEFLKDKLNPKSDTEGLAENADSEAPQQTGYLPNPDDDIPFPVEIGTASGEKTARQPSLGKGVLEALFKTFMETHQAELTQILEKQTETLTDLLERLDRNTHDIAAHQTNRLIDAIKTEAGKQKEYADIIESTGQTPVLVPDETEGF
ncbi:MAG: hypothetical protein IJV07_03395 [Alphaproteobacteria bacterium]|nr:hypothetical protein [Alphaproteobacteria bacterium]